MTDQQLTERVAENLARVQDNIQSAGGKDATLVCVTKYAEDDWVRALLAAGAADLAENYLPRAAERFDELRAAGYSFRRHLIGPPQSRKVKLIPGHFDLVQAVDRLKIARLLNDCLGDGDERLDVLLQINVAREEQKHGVDPDQAEQACGEVLEHCPRLHLRGLMAVPPWPDAYGGDDEFERETRRYFRQMRALFDRIRAACPTASGFDVLSLGMSLDYVWAIEEGATMVRVGSALYAGLAEG